MHTTAVGNVKFWQAAMLKLSTVNLCFTMNCSHITAEILQRLSADVRGRVRLVTLRIMVSIRAKANVRVCIRPNIVTYPHKLTYSDENSLPQKCGAILWCAEL